MKYTEEIYSTLSHGGFISSNSLSPAVRRYYDAIEEELTDYYEYYKGIGFYLESGDLGCDGVDGVDHVVIVRKIELIRCLRQIEALMHAHVAVRVDLQNALAHDLDLVLADGFARGDDLPVEVRQTDLVVVDKIKRADTAAHKRLADIAAHAADAEHGHARTLQLLHGLRAEQKLRS